MQNDSTASLGKDVEAYVQVQYKIVRLKAVNELSSVGSWLFSHMVSGIFLVSALLFLGTGVAFYLASLSGSIILGFCLVAGFYFILFLLFFLFRRRFLKNPVRNKIINTLLEEDI